MSYKFMSCSEYIDKELDRTKNTINDIIVGALDDLQFTIEDYFNHNGNRVNYAIEEALEKIKSIYGHINNIAEEAAEAGYLECEEENLESDD